MKNICYILLISVCGNGQYRKGYEEGYEEGC